jgi:hypothetical protein
MRTIFINVACRKTAKKRAPWAAIITKVNAGFLAFESVKDFKIWKLNK